MAEIRCPMCSKMNPAELDVCQFCQARLKPLVGAQDSPSSPYPFGHEEELPDWLKSLTPETDQDTESPPQEQDSAPEWLRRIREKSQKDARQEEDGPEWLRNIRGGEGSPAGPGTASLPGAPAVTGSLGGDLDWIDRLKTGHLNLPPELMEPDLSQEETPAAQSKPPQPASGVPVETPPPEEKQSPEQPPTATPGPGMMTGSLGGSEWIDRLKTGHLNLPPELLDQPTSDSDTSEVSGAEAEVTPPEAPAVTGALGGDLTWIDRLKTGHLNLEPPADEEPLMRADTLAEEISQEPGPPVRTHLVYEAETGPSPQTGETPHAGASVEIPAVEAAISPSIQEPAPAEPVDDTPDWLKDFAILASQESQDTAATDHDGRHESSESTGITPSSAATFDELPEWLRTAEPGGGAVEATPWSNLEASQDAPPSELPDWLSSLAPDLREETEPTSLSSEAPSAPSWIAPAPGEIPSWSDIAASFTEAGSSKPVSDLGKARDTAPSEPSPFSHFLAEQTETQTPDGAPSQAQAGAPPAASVQDETPDWLAALEAHSTIQSVESSVPALSFDEPASPRADATAEAPVDPFVLSDLPDWLAGLGAVRSAARSIIEPEDGLADLTAGPAGMAGDEGTAPVAEVEGLAPAELPSWIQALRPIESVAPKAQENELDQRVEKSGPLAGLRGTLPSESMAGTAVRPPSFAVKLEATDTQKQYARIFDELIASETDPQPATGDHLISSQRILRLVLAILLLVVIGYPTLTRTQVLPVPRLYSHEIILLRDAVDRLPENAPVLVAVDYDLSLAGEVEIAASAVVDHLMARAARMVTVSTSPTGPVLAESLIEAVTAQPAVHRTGYADGSRWISLGYLAGGPAGLLNFAQTPMLAAPAYQPDGERAWTKPPMQGVTGLNDFAMVMVLTDSYDTGRMWLEQIQPELNGSIPFVMVASAQAAPLLRPYLDGGQVDGLVSGLAGAASYEQLRQQPGAGTATWDAFQAGIIGSIALILIGGIVYQILGLVRRPRTAPEAVASEGVESHGTG